VNREQKADEKRATWLCGAPLQRCGGAGAVAGIAVVFAAGAALFAGPRLAAQPTVPPPAVAHHGTQAALPQASLAAQPAATASTAPATPPPPDWPANDRPSEATVTWDSHGLRVVAANSSLTQILRAVATQTGSTLEGLTRDQRVFGVYGPGPARDVIGQLLDGSGYNVLMVGDLGQGTPRQIILTAQSAGGSQPGRMNGQNSGDDDTSEAEQEAEQPEAPMPQGQPMPPQAMQPGAAAAVPSRAREQMLQELQQRQQQIMQQQQQNPQ